MGTELIRHHVKEESMDIPAIPPGAPELQPVKKESRVEPNDEEKTKRSVRPRPEINYGSSGDESESEQNQTLSTGISKGVIRGCEECSNCQKVIARWHPEKARRPDLLEAPVFYPTEEEFEDTLKYIASIRDKAEAYGICRIVPPSSWKPPCPLKEKNVWENSAFATRVQRVDKLQNRDSLNQILRPNCHKKSKRRKCMKVGLDLKTHVPDTGAPVDLMA
ncbi:hypothetical protein M8C21_005665, partial [Ambrosia artemisiifolia]